jgi:hypothetical protein
MHVLRIRASDADAGRAGRGQQAAKKETTMK